MAAEICGIRFGITETIVAIWTHWATMKKKTASDLLPQYDFSSGVRGKFVECLKNSGIVRAEQAPHAAQPAAPKSPTKRQSEYLAFIAKYITRFGRAPAESDIERHFLVAAPSVNQMMQTLERHGFITRQPGVPRSIRICIDLAGPSGRDEAQFGAGSSNPRVKLPRMHPGAKPPPLSKIPVAAILDLSVQQRVLLAMLILESVAAVPAAVAVGADLRAELDKRIGEFEADPEAGYSWEQVKAILRDGRWRSA